MTEVAKISASTSSSIDIENENNIYLTQDITQSSIDNAIKKIHDINIRDDRNEKLFAIDNIAYNRKPIKIYISSYGGSVYSGLGIIGAIQTSKTPIHTIALGKAMSMGFLILISGHKSYAYPHTTFMYHALSSWLGGQLDDLKDQYEECVRVQKLLDNIVTSNTLIPLKKLIECQETKFNWYFDTNEAIALGVILDLI